MQFLISKKLPRLSPRVYNLMKSLLTDEDGDAVPDTGGHSGIYNK
ncbi:unnamed protein product [Enterobius vermicularis]|uniref:Uncharacterized protein n=1 Tax=Enterobius vermicularis TaxID=51028 RepID=A0A0N4VJU3_ENTVE|nr:unnamed protein product [Enterobius vermicularis]